MVWQGYEGAVSSMGARRSFLPEEYILPKSAAPRGKQVLRQYPCQPKARDWRRQELRTADWQVRFDYPVYGKDPAVRIRASPAKPDERSPEAFLEKWETRADVEVRDIRQGHIRGYEFILFPGRTGEAYAAGCVLYDGADRVKLIAVCADSLPPLFRNIRLRKYGSDGKVQAI